VHATAVTVSQSMPAAAVCTMASCYNCSAHSLPDPIVPFVLVQSTVMMAVIDS